MHLNLNNLLEQRNKDSYLGSYNFKHVFCLESPLELLNDKIH